MVVGKKGDSLLSFRCWKSFRTTKVATPEKSRLSPFFRRHKTGPYAAPGMKGIKMTKVSKHQNPNPDNS